MTRLTWNAVDERLFEAGVDRAVLYPNAGTPVAWNGLISVDQGGSDGVTSYYLDGRPYLHVPTPREYSATIRAFTYPDAFAPAIGMVEVDTVDGMYVDSQIADSFSLCYRTLVGNATEGLDYGYKIHLIYNAVVVPASVGYESLSQDLNPTEFSWDISAVPVPVVGYRPTAHIVIDTRHMEADRIAEIEALIYGTASTAPTLPDPQTIMDLLTFGDAVIITDNGDGTWTVKASHTKLYDVGDGIFQIDDVERTINGDGTFLVETTGA